MSMKVKPRTAAVIQNEFHAAVVKFLQAVDWVPVVTGAISIEARPPLKFNYRLVVDFTGARKKSKRGGR